MINKIKNLDSKVKISIIIVVIAVFLVILSLAIRKASYTHTWLVCEIDHTDQYYEVLKFRYDIDNKFYGYYREEKYHDMSDEVLEANYQEKKQERERVLDSLSDNFQYQVIREDNQLIVKTYIGVSVFPNFFNNYIGIESIRSTSTIDEVKSFFDKNNYKCNISRK